MKFRGRNRMHSEVQTHAFNDIMFFLMMFFLIAATLANPSAIKLTLPKAKGEKSIVRKPIELSIDANLIYYIGKTPVPYEELEAALSQVIETEKANGNQDPVVKLFVDQSVTMQKAAEIMDIGANLNVKMLLALQRKG
ncbi:MAG: biopolymer transporter ExbD [Bacteroidota bacterium]